MGLCRRRSNLFHQILAQRGLCNSFCNHLPLLVDKHRRRSLRSPDGCLRQSIRFILPCRIKYPGCPITLVLDHSVVAEVCGEDEAEEVEGVGVEVGVGVGMVAEGEGGNR